MSHTKKCVSGINHFCWIQHILFTLQSHDLYLLIEKRQLIRIASNVIQMKWEQFLQNDSLNFYCDKIDENGFGWKEMKPDILKQKIIYADGHVKTQRQFSYFSILYQSYVIRCDHTRGY